MEGLHLPLSIKQKYNQLKFLIEQKLLLSEYINYVNIEKTITTKVKLKRVWGFGNNALYYYSNLYSNNKTKLLMNGKCKFFFYFTTQTKNYVDVFMSLSTSGLFIHVWINYE